MATNEQRAEELRIDALDRLRSLESEVTRVRVALEQSKLSRLSETGHLVQTALQVDTLIARLVEVGRK
jgi:hypothetical protein